MARVTNDQAQKAILQRFIEAYPKHRHLHFENIIARDKPDFEATIQETGERVGIEVTGVYQDEREAKINYSVMTEWASHTQDADKIVAALNTCLVKKARSSQQYQFDGRMLLSIWIGSFVFNTPRDFKFISPLIKVPTTKFNELWLVLKDQSSGESVLFSL
jgi:hypothetical protein